MGEAIGGVRAAFMRMLTAHLALLRAELAVAGKELGLIVALGAAALFVAILMAILLYVGAFLFLGEFLFGSMGWGIIHGTLLAIAVIGYAAVNLAGGDPWRYGWGLAIGVATTIVLALLLLTNVGNESGEWFKRWLVDGFETERLPFGDEWLVLLSGLAIGAIAGLVAGLLVAWRAKLSGRERVAAIGGLVFVGAVAMAFYLPTRYAAPDGVLGLAIMVGLLTWIISGLALAAVKGFDPQARYANLLPRESWQAFQDSKEFAAAEWERQKGRMRGR